MTFLKCVLPINTVNLTEFEKLIICLPGYKKQNCKIGQTNRKISNGKHAKIIYRLFLSLYYKGKTQ